MSEEFDVVEKGNKVEDGHWKEQDQSGGEGRLQQTNNYEKNKQTITRTNKQTNNYENKKSANVKVKSKVEERIKTCKSEWKKDSSTNKRLTDGDG